MNAQETEPQKRTCRVLTVLTPQIVKRLDAIAERKIVRRSLLIRQACEKMLKEWETEQEAA